MRNKGKKKSLLNFLIEIKGYTYADALATEIKYWNGEDLPENIENDCGEGGRIIAVLSQCRNNTHNSHYYLKPTK